MNFYHSDMPSAPVLSGTAGSLISILDSVLVDGYATKSVSSLAVSGGVATATITTPNPFVVGGKVQIAGSSISALNGQQIVTSITSTSVSFATAANNGTASGAITAKVPSLGWTKQFTGTNKVVYKSSAPEALGFVLRVDDSGTQTARLVAYESMTDVDTGVRPFPTSAQMSGGYYWAKSNLANSDARKWAVFGDERIFYFCAAPNSGYVNNFYCCAFGDAIPVRSGDAFACFLTGARGVYHSTTTSPEEDLFVSRKISSPNPTTRGGVLTRSFTGIGGPAGICFLGNGMHGGITDTYSGGIGYGIGTFPNPADNGLYLTKVLGISGNGYRVVVPGLLHAVQDTRGAFNTFEIVDGTGDMAGRKVMFLPAGSTGSEASGIAGFDITGPWR